MSMFKSTKRNHSSRNYDNIPNIFKSKSKDFFTKVKPKITDSYDEPVRPFAGTVNDFVSLLNNSPSKVGLLTGIKAHKYMLSLDDTEFSWKQMRPLPTETGYFNRKKGRYIYTKKGGWIDMAHFMFYAGKAYSYKQQKNEAKRKLNKSKSLNRTDVNLIKTANMSPVGEAIQDGYKQEFSDKYAAKHSAYSYEDLPSDKFGADFAVNHFDYENKNTLAEQIQSYLVNQLEATEPTEASNYEKLPKDDSSKEPPSITNKTTNPISFNK